MRKHSFILTAALVCTLIASNVAVAHGGMEHVLGTVTAVTDHSLAVKTRDGAIKTVEFDGQTRFVKGEVAATVKDVHVGSRVAIHAHSHDNALHAAEVKIGAETPAQH
jgi:hypothetical protein